MAKQIYQLKWNIRSYLYDFTRSEWKVFDSEKEAEDYGLCIQTELNNGLSPEEKIEQDSYCYEFVGAFPMEELDGYLITLEEKQ